MYNDRLRRPTLYQVGRFVCQYLCQNIADISSPAPVVVGANASRQLRCLNKGVTRGLFNDKKGESLGALNLGIADF